MKLLDFKYVLILLAFGIGCTSIETTDPNYASTLNELSDIEITTVFDQIVETTLEQHTSLDNFGFPFITLNDSIIELKDWYYKTSTSELKQKTKEAVTEFGTFLNQSDSSLIKIASIRTTTGLSYAAFFELYPDSLPPIWLVTTKRQTLNNYEILGTSLKFAFSPEGLIAIGGHCYSSVYIPSPLSLNEDDCKQLVYNETLTYKNTEITPKVESLWYNSKRLILPIRKSNKIEIRVCWALYI